PTAPVNFPINGTTYNIGHTFGTYTVVDNDNNTNFIANGLNPNVRYYFYIYAFNNNNCVNGPRYSTPRTNNIVTADVNYCASNQQPTTSNATNYYIQRVSFMRTLNDVTNTSTFSNNPRGYENFTGLPNRASQLQGEGINVYVENRENSETYNTRVRAWVDWNRDGDFNDTGELIYTTGTTTITSTTFGFIIPVGTAPGNYRIRIRVHPSSNPSACGNMSNGETEDYLFTVVQRCNVN